MNSGGVASSTIVNGGAENVGSGGTANSTTVNEAENVESGGIANNTIVNGGAENVAGGTANSAHSSTTVNAAAPRT